MQTNTPKWKPSALRSIVKASAREMGIRNTAHMVLRELLSVVNYKTGFARMGTPKICDNIGRCERSVKEGLQILRDTGLLYYVGRAGGGKTALYGFRYTLKAVKDFNQKAEDNRRAIFAPLIVGEYLDKGCKNFQNGVQKIPLRGAKIAPPSPIVNNSQVYEDDPNGPTRGVGVPNPYRKWDGQEAYSQYLGDKRWFEKEGAIAPT